MSETPSSETTSSDAPESSRTPRTAATVIAAVAVVAALVVVGLLASNIGAPMWLTFAVVGGLGAIVVLAYVLN